MLGLCGFGLALVGTSKYGVGLSPDSIHYVHAARSVMAGDGFQAFGGGPFVGWPPLFPTVLAALGKLGLDPLDGARFLNGAIFGLTIYASGHLLRTHLKSAWVCVAATATLLVSLTLVRVSIMAWSEPLFVLMAVLTVIYLSRFIQEQRITFFLLAAGCAALAALDRYIGFSLAIAGAATIFLLLPALPWRRRAIYAGLFGAVSLAPLTLWLARNQWVSDSFTGSRAGPESSFIENLGDTAAEFSSWLLPSQYISSSIGQAAVVTITIVALAAMVGYLVWAKLARGASEESRRLGPVGIFALVYTGSLVITASLVGFDAIGGRMLSPVYVPVLLFVVLSLEEVTIARSMAASSRWLINYVWPLTGALLVLAFVVAAGALVFGRVEELVCGSQAQNQVFTARICQADGALRLLAATFIWLTGLSCLALGVAVFSLRRKNWIGRVALTGIISIWLLYPVIQTGMYVKTRTESGAGGFNSDQWRESPLIQKLRLSPLEGTVYSNAPNILYILTDADKMARPSVLPDSPEQLNTRDPDQTYLVWIEPGDFQSAPQFQTAPSRYSLIDQAIFPDGGIFLIRK